MTLKLWNADPPIPQIEHELGAGGTWMKIEYRILNDNLDRLRTALSDRYAIEEELGAGGMATVVPSAVGVSPSPALPY